MAGIKVPLCSRFESRSRLAIKTHEEAVGEILGPHFFLKHMVSFDLFQLAFKMYLNRQSVLRHSKFCLNQPRIAVN